MNSNKAKVLARFSLEERDLAVGELDILPFGMEYLDLDYGFDIENPPKAVWQKDATKRIIVKEYEIAQENISHSELGDLIRSFALKIEATRINWRMPPFTMSTGDPSSGDSVSAALVSFLRGST